MDKSVQNLITTVPTGTHQFLLGNHRPTGLWYTVKYRPPEYFMLTAVVVSWCHNSFLQLEMVVHDVQLCPSEQHFPLLWNLFKPKTYDFSRLPKGYLEQIPKMGIRFSQHLK